jgi:predicted transcriptional regulator
MATAGRNKKHSTIYYSAVADKLLDLLAQDMGIKRTQVVEQAIRDLAKKRKVEIPAQVLTGDTERGKDGTE